MSEEWDSVTRIGSSVRRGPGTAQPQQRVVRGASALNAAQRMGGVQAEKKYGGTNQVSNTGGQRLTKVDREDDIVKLTVVGKEVGDKIQEMRKKDNNPAFHDRDADMTRDQLAQACSVRPAVIAEFESGQKKKSDPDYNKTIGLIERALNVVLQGKKFGQPKFPIKNKPAVTSPTTPKTPNAPAADEAEE